MRSLHVLQHAPTEGPGRVADVARTMGLAIAVHPLFEGAPPPDAIPAGDALVVMGGSMGVGDIGDARWPFLGAEVDFIRRTLREGRPILGICLGAQLMAHALGARVVPLTVGDPPARYREVGWGAVTFVASPDDEPALAGLNESEVALHWHEDTFELPRGAERLASTLACPNQMFRFGRRAFAVQFHVEVTAADVERWVAEDAAFVKAANGPRGAERVLADTRRFMPRHRHVGHRMIRNMLAILLGGP